ncbi:MAG TPA: LysE family translocator [Terriglobales bacterium]|jgi:threonine/homoserine/homoserine lactone efflux protein|nr:LysE family translocator [Terriglobales bacterium]
MPDHAAFLAFLVAALALNFAPGPDMLYVLGRSLGQGRKAGVVSALGIFAGCLVHIAAAALGLAALLQASVTAYNIIRYAGAAYLIYLGVRMLLSKKAHNALSTSNSLPSASLSRIFIQGVITNVLNPKVAMFFVAFLPQFVNAARGSVVFQIAVLGLIFDIGGTLVNIGVAFFAGHIGNRLRQSARAASLQRWFTGSIFIGLGLRLGLAGRK